MSKVRLFTVLLVILLLAAGNVSAKNLQGRTALGFNSQLSSIDNTFFNTQAISLKYWTNSRLCIQGLLGVMMDDRMDEVDFGGKVLYNIKQEQNMNVYAGGGVGIANVDPDPGDSDTALFVSGILGVEFFLSGLPNLGFSTELGLKFYNSDDFDAVGTDADTFMEAGIHYYFGP